MKIPEYLAFQYSEVWKVTEIRNGAVYKTKFTGFHIKDSEANTLPPGYVTATISASPGTEVELNLVSVDSLQ